MPIMTNKNIFRHFERATSTLSFAFYASHVVLRVVGGGCMKRYLPQWYCGSTLPTTKKKNTFSWNVLRILLNTPNYLLYIWIFSVYYRFVFVSEVARICDYHNQRTYRLPEICTALITESHSQIVMMAGSLILLIYRVGTDCNCLSPEICHELTRIVPLFSGRQCLRICVIHCLPYARF